MYNFGVQPEICSMGVSIQVDVTHSVTCQPPPLVGGSPQASRTLAGGAGCYLVRNLTSCYLTHTGIQFSPLLHRTTTGSTDHRIAMKVFSQLGVL